MSRLERRFQAHNGCASFHSPVGLDGIANLIPQILRTMWSFCAQHIFQNPLPECRRHRCPQTDHKAFSRTVLNGSSRETSAERGLPNPEEYLTVQGLECSTICILTNGWQLWTNLYWKLWALPLTRRCLNRFFFGRKKNNKQPSPITDMMQVQLMG